MLDQNSKHDFPGKYLPIKKQGRVQLIELKDILFIQGANIYAEIHLLNGKRELSNKNLENLSQILPNWFARIHKSYIANMHQAKEITVHPGAKYELQLADGRSLPVGRTRYPQIRDQFFS